MIDQLKEKALEQGRLASELKGVQGYQLISEKMSSKKESLLIEALNSKTIENLRYNKGFIDGLSFFTDTVEQLIRRGEAAKKKN